MAWTTRFQAALHDRTTRIRFVLESLDKDFDGALTGGLVLATSPGLGGVGVITHVGTSTSAAEVSPLSWTSTIGAFSVGVVVEQVAGVLGVVRRGQAVMLRAGFAGWTLDEFEPIAIGQVRNVRGSVPNFVIECRDILGLLSARVTTDAGKMSLFHGIGTATTRTTLSAGYTAADTTLSVTSDTQLVKQNDGSGALNGVVLVSPSSGDPFFLTFTGYGAGPVLTGVSTTGQFGTTAVNAASGSQVYAIPYLDDHPIDAVRRILTSTGTANGNGAYDWLPETWGYGLPERFVDGDDMTFFRGLSTPASGSDDWDILSATVQENGLSWMQQVLSLGGFFLTMSQGAITCRAAVDPNETATRNSISIDDRDIAAIEDQELFDSSYPAEYGAVTFETGSASTTRTAASLQTLPAGGTYEYDASGLVFTNEAAWRTEVLDRLEPWATRVPERLVVRCSGRRTALLAPGDVIELTSRLGRGRLPTTRFGYAERRALVSAVSPDWIGGSVRLALRVLPRGDEA